MMNDLFKVKHGFAFDGKYFSSEGEYILLSPGNFHDAGGFKLKDKEKYFTGEIPEDYVLSKGDLLVAMTEQAEGLLGSSALIPSSNRFLHNQRLGLITDWDAAEIDLRFLYHLFNTREVRAQIRASATGTKVRHTSPSRIGEVRVAIPDVATQRKIASILSTYDDLIENNTRRIAILEEMAQSLYREWFVEFRFPGHEKARFIDSPMGKIPGGWKSTTLGSVVENHDRLRKPLSAMQRVDMKGRYPYYGAAKIFDYINAYIFDGKYLLMAEDGSVITPDRKPVLQMAYGKFWVNNHAHILQGRSPVSTEHIYVALSFTDVAGYVTGAAQPKITQTNMNRMPFLQATDDLQRAFADFLVAWFDERHVLERKNDTLHTTRDLLLPKLMSGQVDVEELDIDIGESLAEADA